MITLGWIFAALILAACGFCIGAYAGVLRMRMKQTNEPIYLWNELKRTLTFWNWR